MTLLEPFLLVLTWAMVGLSAIPLAVVVVEVAGALTFRPRTDHAIEPETNGWPRSVVLVPMHNEQEVLANSLVSLSFNLPPNTSLLCVAHNCSDASTAIARSFGASVIEVFDDGTGGKPAALVAGLKWLDADPPDIVVIVDADCEVQPGTLSALVKGAFELGHPVMGTYLFGTADGTAGKSSMSRLAILLKNHIRPLGLSVFGLPCLLNGSGSAYPFAAIRKVPHGQGSIAEDFQLTIDLLRLGYPTTYVPEAKICGKLPANDKTAFRQRTRWEHGHLSLVFGTAPRLLLEGLRRLDMQRIALALEVGVPPLGLLGLYTFVVFLVTLSFGLLTDDWAPLQAALAFNLLFCISVLVSWIRFAGWPVTSAALRAMPAYLLWKLPLYFRFFKRPETVWKKTGRD
jgi:cellulose synthase/poly-beta-1,6-N-acetylglucosamine synthase-like glycosyltransferase